MSHSSALSGLRVLVTRPEHQAKSLISALKETLAIPILFSTMTITSSPDHPSVSAALQHYEQANSLIFTSSNAVENGVFAIKKANKAWPPIQLVFAIGPATHYRLKVSNCNTIIMPDTHFSSEGLLACPELKNTKNEFIIIFGGNNPRPFLAEQLQKRGAHVAHAACYTRQALDAKLDEKQQIALLNNIDTIVCTSHEILLNFIGLFDKNIHNYLFCKEFLVVSSQMTDTLKRLGYIKSPIVADNPTDRSIISALTRWHEEHHDG